MHVHDVIFKSSLLLLALLLQAGEGADALLLDHIHTGTVYQLQFATTMNAYDVG